MQHVVSQTYFHDSARCIVFLFAPPPTPTPPPPLAGAAVDASDAGAAVGPQESEEGGGQPRLRDAQRQLRADAVRGAHEGHQGQEVPAQTSHGQ